MGLLNVFRRRDVPIIPSLPEPEEMMRVLEKLDDKQWGRYAFRREPLEGKFTTEQKQVYIHAATQCGCDYAHQLVEKYGSRDPWKLAKHMGITIKTPAIPAGGGQVLFAQFAEPDEITIFTDCLERAAGLKVLPTREKLERILLAHELFHVVEHRNPEIYTRTETVELWRKPFSNRSHLICLSEIAAMAFAKTLLELPWSPYLLDVMLVYPYDAEAACALYEEICDIIKEE